MRNPVLNQKMADLPLERVIPAPPFTHTGVDFFGPQEVKEGRQIRKRYGVLFTGLSTRAIHIETANSLDTSYFINALRRFVARRANVKIWCDNGTNFHGAEKELRKSLHEMNDDQVRTFLSKESISWTFNPPTASHMGGVWERQIRTVRKVLTLLFKEHAGRLDDESYRTLLTEVEAIVNDRPLATVSGSPDDLQPLGPAQLLTQKSSVVMPPPGVFQKGDMYLRQRWRYVQFLANLFWTRWRRKYLSTLQERQKWNKEKQHLQVGDIVLVKDNNQLRSNWMMGRVISTGKDRTGFVRSVVLKDTNIRAPATHLKACSSPCSRGTMIIIVIFLTIKGFESILHLL
ncbi:uncharacterized protein [Palaemon carinicauda]|uniref:uncharacterized protein n=1 Tax=Palaemon carinicauda TaxID=392227 RepID=UPI0035B64E78